MAEPPQSRGPFQIQVSYWFDRWLEPKLAQAYEILVASLSCGWKDPTGNARGFAIAEAAT